MKSKSRLSHPSSIIVHYDTEQKMLVCNAVAEAAIRPLCEGKLDIPVLLEEFDFKLDDEFARRFGAARFLFFWAHRRAHTRAFAAESRGDFGLSPMYGLPVAR
ncbi:MULTISPECIES: hypothetical protein [Paraburkholderia]|uniref:Uncharacterized protein n=1 Tax=Paraburkholderia podalyriae TaxID=1938811 RepID=A0ABR7PHI0_9BURK|nr:hypothetical protein [Paraburkholderia podalyriae]MBC8745792.1 hypothetical protein [Paraburkholderia podalyriae]